MRKLLDAIDELDRCAAEDTSLVFKKVKQEAGIAEMELQRLKEHLQSLGDHLGSTDYPEDRREREEFGKLLQQWVTGNDYSKIKQSNTRRRHYGERR